MINRVFYYYKSMYSIALLFMLNSRNIIIRAKCRHTLNKHEFRQNKP